MTMAAEATEADSALARDQAQQAMAREYRLASLRSKRLATDSSPIKPKGAISDALAKAEQLKEFIKKARNIRTILTIAGGLTALTGFGMIWTFFQWNIQSIFTAFGLPGKDWIGMPWWMIGVTLIFDIVVILLVIVIIFLGYAVTNPLAAICLMLKPLFGDHWYTSLLVKGLSLFGQGPK